jgi:hypothetical protein
MMRGAMRDKNETEASIQLLKTEFERLLNENLIHNETDEMQEQTAEERPNLIAFAPNRATIRRILKNRPNGKAIGYANVSSEMFKYGLGTALVEYLHLLFSKMINEDQMPENFNIGVIKPLVKTKKLTISTI